MNFLKEISKDFDIDFLQNYNSPVSNITKASKAISTTLKDYMFERLRFSPFSLSIDGATDCFGVSYLAICVKFLDHEDDDKPLTRLISVIPIEDSSTGETIYNKVKESVLFDPQLTSNFMGLATDEGPNMVGSYQGVAARLKNDFEHIINVRDISHLYNGIFKKAIKAFPNEIFSIMDDIITTFRDIPQKLAVLKDLQRQENRIPLTIIKSGKTRWLTLRNSLERILELLANLEDLL